MYFHLAGIIQFRLNFFGDLPGNQNSLVILDHLRFHQDTDFPPCLNGIAFFHCKNLSYSIGDKIKFKNEKRPYKITACNNRYILAVKPFNLQHTYLYVLVDIEEMVRGADNFKCYGDYSNLKEAAEILKLCNNGEIEVSYRNFRRLDIEKVIKVKQGIVQNG